jgi:hypothetical protein
MTERSILSGEHPIVTIRAGMDVVVEGVEGERVSATVNDRWGMKVERHRGEVKIQLSLSGRVQVPYGSQIRVFTGKNLEIHHVSGDISATAGLHIVIQEGGRLLHASAGGSMEIDCQAIAGPEIKLQSGRDMRIYIRSLQSARLRVNDMGGYWEGQIGAGDTQLTLKAGGDVTLVTDQTVSGLPPNYILGKIEKPVRTA